MHKKGGGVVREEPGNERSFQNRDLAHLAAELEWHSELGVSREKPTD